MGRKHRDGNNEEEEKCSIADLQDAVNDFLHEGEDITPSTSA